LTHKHTPLTPAAPAALQASALRHPFIVPCVESWVVQNHTVNMIYAFCSNGDLAGYLARARKQVRLSGKTARLGSSCCPAAGPATSSNRTPSNPCKPALLPAQGASVDEALLHKWLAQLLLALDYLQSQGVLHRDIKTSNLMLTAEDDVQLGDFGLATLMTHTDGGGAAGV
jgi:serine/threonine protein kinase